FEKKSSIIEDRIVNNRQPHIRPLVRDMTNTGLKPGARLTANPISCNDYRKMHQVHHDHEDIRMLDSIEKYQQQQPYYADKVNVAQKRVERQDASERNAIEGKFGEGKRTYGLGLISACLQNTSETAISISFLMMNIGKILRDSFFTFLLIFHVTFSKENNHI